MQLGRPLVCSEGLMLAPCLPHRRPAPRFFAVRFLLPAGRGENSVPPVLPSPRRQSIALIRDCRYRPVRGDPRAPADCLLGGRRSVPLTAALFAVPSAVLDCVM